ncbi:MAG: 5-formyltetrahydrofolate cyclo-ligase [Clostridia bacterium]|nr:5-formyltetrahydrofolate cyclo-ligase [Clostridia bacterium]
MSADLRKEKNILRAEFKLRRAEIAKKNKQELDRDISAEICSLACFRFADTVLLYSPIGSEIDLSAVAYEALSKGKRVAFPVCNTDDCTLTFRYVSALGELEDGSYSIKEPSADAEQFGNEENSVCIVPALSFDRCGFRIGYGKGYYDRFLKAFRGTAIGAVYSELLCDSLPRGFYDLAVDVIVTERGSIITDAGKEKIGKR